MMIRKVDRGLEIGLNPDDCALLAAACRYAADETQEDGNRPESSRTASYLYYLMACTLDGYSLAADALGRMSGKDAEGYDLASIAREWSPLPQKGGAR